MGLRERKKARTREAIEAAAFSLFAERGFASTTIADIAQAADIAPRTFFSYFPTKEDVVFANFDELAESLDQHLRERDEAQTTFEAMRAWLADVTDARDAQDASRDAVRLRLIRDNTVLAAHERQLLSRFESMIAAAIADELGDHPDDLRPRLVAAAALAALRALRPPGDDDRDRPRTAEDLALLDQAFVFLRGGIAALQDSATSAAAAR